MSDSMCCPLAGYDGDAPKVYNTSTPRAGRDHVCYECHGTIARGERHRLVKGLWYEGGWDTFRLCLVCDEIGRHFACDGTRIFGELWEQLRDNFFPDMRAGGRCMEGLSPAAKQKLIDLRMKWYFERDEIDDSAWDGWTPDKPPRPRFTMPDTRTNHPSWPEPDSDPDDDRWG